MPDYVTNAQISVPLNTGLKADVDLGGLKFSYAQGMFYEVTNNYMPITAPAPIISTPASRGASL